MLQDIQHIIDFAASVMKLLMYMVIIVFGSRMLYNAKIGALIADMHDAKNDHASWMRSIGSVIVVFAIIMAFYQIYKTGETQEGLIIGLIGLALAGKVGQKFAEK
jgi:uncharacterized membrane protein